MTLQAQITSVFIVLIDVSKYPSLHKCEVAITRIHHLSVTSQYQSFRGPQIRFSGPGIYLI